MLSFRVAEVVEDDKSLFDLALRNLERTPANPPGITVFNHEGVSNITHKTENGVVTGILSYLPTGEFVVLVRDDFRRRGIGTTLLRVADDLFQIDWTKSTYSQEGLALLKNYLRGKR